MVLLIDALKIVGVLGLGSVAAISVVLVTLFRSLHVLVVSNGGSTPMYGSRSRTNNQAKDEDETHCALFRHFPFLAGKLAWRELGHNYPTPIHRVNMKSPEGEAFSFSVKREDLASELYGGNKVRTLQFAVGALEAMEVQPRIAALGSGGSNQIVATTVFAAGVHGIPVKPVWFTKDKADLDNTLNMLSTLSLSGDLGITWQSKAKRILGTLWKSFHAKDTVMWPPGGNCTLGVLGQAGGMLELAGQISRGDTADIDAIYLPIGSSCTISGLVLGLSLCRHLSLNAFKNPEFYIHGTIIHAGFAAIHRKIGFQKNTTWAKYMPLSICHSVKRACDLLKSLGCVDVWPLAKDAIKRSLRIAADADVVGEYGGHSPASLAHSQAYDNTAVVTDASGKPQKELWVCGHFVAKNLVYLAHDAVSSAGKKNFMLWQTKSSVQPRGTIDELSLMHKMPDGVKRWAHRGEAASDLREGAFDENDSAKYEGLMTPIASKMMMKGK